MSLRPCTAYHSFRFLFNGCFSCLVVPCHGIETNTRTGSETNIDLFVRQDLATQLRELYDKMGKDHGFLFLLDPKRYSDTGGWNKLAPGDQSLYKTVGNALFDKDGLFRPDKDIAFCWDGRSTRTANLIQKHCLKVGSSSKKLPQRSSIALRLMHHNREFMQGGFAKARVNQRVSWQTFIIFYMYLLFVPLQMPDQFVNSSLKMCLALERCN